MRAWYRIPSATIFVMLAGAACRRQEPVPAIHSEAADAPSANAAPRPEDELASLDRRRPVPLQPIMAWHQKQEMMGHLVAVQQITAALAREDWDEVEKAATLIESPPEMEEMCEHMGAGAEGFTEMGLEFHHRAADIVKAARARDGAAALAATSKTLEACTACHAAFRQEIVDEATWDVRTGHHHEPAMMHDER